VANSIFFLCHLLHFPRPIPKSAAIRVSCRVGDGNDSNMAGSELGRHFGLDLVLQIDKFDGSNQILDAAIRHQPG